MYTCTSRERFTLALVLDACQTPSVLLAGGCHGAFTQKSGSFGALRRAEGWRHCQIGPEQIDKNVLHWHTVYSPHSLDYPSVVVVFFWKTLSVRLAPHSQNQSVCGKHVGLFSYPEND